MTRLLEKAFARVARLPECDQNAIAQWLMEELASGRKWESRLEGSQDALASLADQALAEHRQGRTRQLDPDAL